MFFCKLCKFSSNTSGERSESVGSWLHVYKITKKHIPLNSDSSPQSGDLRNLSPLAHCWWPHVLTCSKQTPKMGVPFHAFIPEIQDTSFDTWLFPTKNYFSDNNQDASWCCGVYVCVCACVYNNVQCPQSLTHKDTHILRVAHTQIHERTHGPPSSF